LGGSTASRACRRHGPLYHFLSGWPASTCPAPRRAQRHAPIRRRAPPSVPLAGRRAQRPCDVRGWGGGRAAGRFVPCAEGNAVSEHLRWGRGAPHLLEEVVAGPARDRDLGDLLRVVPDLLEVAVELRARRTGARRVRARPPQGRVARESRGRGK
jgi:hypothetical protein